MFTSGQMLALICLGVVFGYAIIDRICKCVEATRNPMIGFENVMKFVKSINENGNKPV